MLIRTSLLLFVSSVLSVSVDGLVQDNVNIARKRMDDSHLIDGLRRRRLFELAENYCQSQLSRPKIDPTSQSQLVIELMKTQTAAAMLTDSADRDHAWQKVQATSTQFEQANQDHPRRYLVRVQQALSHLAHGRLLQQEIAADMADESARNRALNEIRTARTLLNNLQREIANAIPDQRRRSLTDHDLTVEQLLNLNNNVRYQLAVCNLNRAQLYDASDRLNRIDALNGVNQRLSEVQRATPELQSLWWKTKLGQIECLRLLGKSTEARALASSLMTEDVPSPTMPQLLEQMVRLAIEIGDATFSQELLANVEALNSRTASLDLVLVELAVDLSTRSQTDQGKGEWLKHATESSRAIEDIHGSYWGRRANLVLIGAVGTVTSQPSDNDPTEMAPRKAPFDSASNTELDLLIRLADEAFRKKRLSDALQAYGRASALAMANGNPMLALQLEVRAGQVLEKQGNHALAGQRLITAAHRDPKLKLAPATHLRGCWNVARTIRPDQPKLINEFEAYLVDHLETWPSEPSANQVRVWLGHQLTLKRQWQSAIDTFCKVASDSAHFPEAVDRLLNCARKLLRSQRKNHQSTRSTASNLVLRLSQMQDSLEATDSVAMKLELARAEVDLIFGSVQRDLNRIEAITTIERTARELQNRARAILIALQCFDHPDRANDLLAGIQDDTTALDLCDRCLAGVIANQKMNKNVDSALATRLAVIDYALRLPGIADPDNDQDRTRWLLRKTEVLTATQRHADSIIVLAELEKKFPQSASIQMQMARAMTMEFGKTNPGKPLAKWRHVASQLKSHTSNWYESKYEVARLLSESGQKAEAAKLLKYVQAIPPGWEQSEYKSKFESLLKACQSGY